MSRRPEEAQADSDRLAAAIADAKSGPWTVDLAPLEQVARDGYTEAARGTEQPYDRP